MRERKIYFVMALEPICPGDDFLNQLSPIPTVPAARLKYSIKHSIALRYPRRFKLETPEAFERLVEGCCGEPDCPICGPFGFWRDGRRIPGAAVFSDVISIFVSVDGLEGRMWCTSHTMFDRLVLAGLLGWDDLQIRLPRDSFDVQGPFDEGILTLGWMPLKVAHRISPLKPSARAKLSGLGVPEEVLDRTVLTSDGLLSHLLRDNPIHQPIELIDPQTNEVMKRSVPLWGMIPQGTIMYFTVGYSRRKDIVSAVEDGISHLEHIGVGGLTSREVGRIKLLKSQEV
jgi:hypothetical protein